MPHRLSFILSCPKASRGLIRNFLVRTSRRLIGARRGERRNSHSGSMPLAKLTRAGQRSDRAYSRTESWQTRETCKVAGAEQALTKLLAFPQRTRSACGLGSVEILSNWPASSVALVRMRRISNLPETEAHYGGSRVCVGGRLDGVAPILEKVVQSPSVARPGSRRGRFIGRVRRACGRGKIILDNWRGYSPPARKHAVDALLAQEESRSHVAEGPSKMGRWSAPLSMPAPDRNLYEDQDPAIVKRAPTPSWRARIAIGQKSSPSITMRLLCPPMWSTGRSYLRTPARVATCPGGKADVSAPIYRASTTRPKRNCYSLQF